MKYFLLNQILDIYFNEILINAINKTALFVAVENGNIDIVKLLLSNNNIDVNIINTIINLFFKCYFKLFLLQ